MVRQTRDGSMNTTKTIDDLANETAEAFHEAMQNGASKEEMRALSRERAKVVSEELVPEWKRGG